MLSYFIAYQWRSVDGMHGFGRCFVNRADPVCSIEDIKGIEASIGDLPDHRGKNKIIVQHWQRFEEKV
ncbi:hypothetical protein [Cupriavidus campinensis]|uniref:Uncharacterized protein n=1 Tax=Cupriavidus campinensis TaxID=151783 RepID=A0ABY3ESS4_9BURK|nr:hypothetical protein [Cupriavidus campinensis]TSP14023.1 hypothetical protein FGG12_06010 [Cupriavidus campinensis]